MIKLQTPVIDEKCLTGISFSDKIMMLGSCFSDNIGQQLKDFGFDVSINPFGTLYNPISILNSVRRLASGTPFCMEDCVGMGAGSELTCSFSHHTSAARKDARRFISDANQALALARHEFMESNKLIITLGTSWCFRHIENDTIVSNCLKRPASEFARERLSSSKVTDVLHRISELCQGRQIVFTVSPIRHFKDGAHGNQISKSALLLGIEDFLCGCPVDLSMNPRYPADYFPAYEIMMDELRDYRFYAEDMCHPSQQAVNYIRERFLSWALPASEHPLLEENIRAFKHASHKKS